VIFSNVEYYLIAKSPTIGAAGTRSKADRKYTIPERYQKWFFRHWKSVENLFNVPGAPPRRCGAPAAIMRITCSQLSQKNLYG
jgi:hypothetical protein